MGFNQHFFDDLTTRNHDFYGDVTIKPGDLATQCHKPPILKGLYHPHPFLDILGMFICLWSGLPHSLRRWYDKIYEWRNRVQRRGGAFRVSHSLHKMMDVLSSVHGELWLSSIGRALAEQACLESNSGLKRKVVPKTRCSMVFPCFSLHLPAVADWDAEFELAAVISSHISHIRLMG